MILTASLLAVGLIAVVLLFFWMLSMPNGTDRDIKTAFDPVADRERLPKEPRRGLRPCDWGKPLKSKEAAPVVAPDRLSKPDADPMHSIYLPCDPLNPILNPFSVLSPLNYVNDDETKRAPAPQVEAPSTSSDCGSGGSSDSGSCDCGSSGGSGID
jgi:hypothetical protein